MRRIWSFKQMMIILMILSGFCRILAQEPLIRLSTTDLFLGRGKATDTLTDSLTIYNDGDADLHIRSLFTGCRCTSASYPHTTITPGDSMVVKLRYHDPKQPPGRFRKLLRIRSNCSNPTTRFFITGVILPDRD